MLPCSMHEPYVLLYPGDYLADTMRLSSCEHRIFRLLLLKAWLGNSGGANPLPLDGEEQQSFELAVSPLIAAVRPRIDEAVARLRLYDGQRLPPALWNIVRAIVFERDGYACVYCGSSKHLAGDHIVPLCRGGSNALYNIATACRACNQMKGKRTPDEWP